MIAWGGWSFPDGEAHLPARMKKFNIRVDGRFTYQYPLYTVAVKNCTQRRLAVDVGAHVGLFSYFMVRDFSRVVAFEPVAAHRECWTVNVPARTHDALYPVALGARPGQVALAPVQPNSSGGTRIIGPGDVPLTTLDAYELADVDFLKIDTEGYELEVVQGAVETLARCHPVVCVEQRGRTEAQFHHKHGDAVRWLQRQGAEVAWTDTRDYVMTWRHD